MINKPINIFIMKDLTRKIFAIGFPLVLISYMLIRLLINYLFHKELIAFMELTIESLVFALVFTTFQGFILIQILKPKISFLKSASPIEKRFGNIETSINLSDKKFDFQDFVKSLKKDFIITFSDENKNLIKLREKFRFWSWGAAATIDIENDSLIIRAFPFNATGDKTSINLTKKIKARL